MYTVHVVKDEIIPVLYIAMYMYFVQVLLKIQFALVNCEC